MSSVVSPGAWLGLLGGGQLGRMFCMAAQSLGYKVAVLDPGEYGPAGSVADRHIRADYLDPRGLAELAALASADTTEFENVPAAALAFLARYPTPESAERLEPPPRVHHVAVAAVGRVAPLRRLMTVVLPAPFGPIRAWRAPFLIRNDT